MSLISRLILGPNYTPNELYNLLKRDGEKDRNKDGGLGKIFKKDSISNALQLDHKQQLLYVKNVDQLYLLAKAFHSGDKTVNHQNDNKYAICLALIYQDIIENKQQVEKSELLKRVTDELLTLLDKGGNLQSLAIPSSEKSKVLEHLRETEASLSAKTNNNSSRVVLAKLTSDQTLPTFKTSLSPAAAPIPLSEMKQVENAVVSLELDYKIETFIEDAERINRVLTQMKDAGKDILTIPAKKFLQRKYFESEMKKSTWQLEELVKLLEYMFQIQDGTHLDHPFKTIRTEQSRMLNGKEWNTETWQHLIYEVKQCTIEMLVLSKSNTNPPAAHIVLSDEDYNKYHALFAKHSSRVCHWHRTNSVADFENVFISHSAENQQVMQAGYAANAAASP